MKYTGIILQSATDISRMNLLELDIPAEGTPIALKPYSVSLRYRELIDQESKKLEMAGIISRSMSDWACLIFIVPKKEERSVPTKQNHSMSNSTKPKKEFNLRLCTHYRKLDSHIVTARKLKTDGSIGKVVANYPLPTTNNLLARFKGCKYFLQ